MDEIAARSLNVTTNNAGWVVLLSACPSRIGVVVNTVTAGASVLIATSNLGAAVAQGLFGHPWPSGAGPGNNNTSAFTRDAFGPLIRFEWWGRAAGAVNVAVSLTEIILVPRGREPVQSLDDRIARAVERCRRERREAIALAALYSRGDYVNPALFGEPAPPRNYDLSAYREQAQYLNRPASGGP